MVYETIVEVIIASISAYRIRNILFVTATHPALYSPTTPILVVFFLRTKEGILRIHLD